MIATQERTDRRGGRSRTRWLGWVLTALLVALPWAWFAVRDLDPLMDAVAIGLPLATAVLALAAFAAAAHPGWTRLALVGLSLVAFTVAIVVGPRLPQSSTEPLDPLRLVAANTYESNAEPDTAARALAAARPDVLVAVETSDELVSALRRDLGRFRYVQRAQLSVFARWPLTQPTEIPGVPPGHAVRVDVDRPGAPFVLYAVHLPNPIHEVSFAQQAVLVETLLDAARTEPSPVVLAGDFNMTDRSSSYRVLEGPLRDAMRSSFAGSTYQQALWRLLQLRIDHVFVSPVLCATGAATLEVPGSDHRGLDVVLGRCA